MERTWRRERMGRTCRTWRTEKTGRPWRTGKTENREFRKNRKHQNGGNTENGKTAGTGERGVEMEVKVCT